MRIPVLRDDRYTGPGKNTVHKDRLRRSKFMNATHSFRISHLDYTDERSMDFRNTFHNNTKSYRSLAFNEREVLTTLGNTATDWDRVEVSEHFDPTLVRRCNFYGTVRIGELTSGFLKFHDLSLPIGLSDSLIISSDIGDNAVIRNVGYLSRYVIGNEVVLFNIDEMGATDHAKFGNGIIMDGEGEDVRIWLEIANENGGRGVLPFETIETGDAYLWSRFRSDSVLQNAFVRMTEAQYDTRRGGYGVVGDHSVIKSCRIVKDIKVGSWAYIKGANKLKNLTIESCRKSPTQIGEGVELVNGIVGTGSRAFYGAKAVRFIMRTNTCLKYGARLINSILGDNGTISCCEVLNSLVMPGHEQHHNNSFLCAATVLGQSNIAAGATIGSNHNSRSNDGELVAGRGFWPGLSVSLKHSSRFASYCLIAKGSYQAELNVPIAFTLVATEPENLILRPAFWFLHNMYALARNSWKYHDRDKRLYHYQSYEVDYLAPDTIIEIMESITLLELWSGVAGSSDSNRCTLPKDTFGGKPPNCFDAEKFREEGKEILTRLAAEQSNARCRAKPYILENAGIEKSSRPIRIYDVPRAWKMFRDMATLYAVRSLIAVLGPNEPLTQAHIDNAGLVRKGSSWTNIGGQLVRDDVRDALLSDIRTGDAHTWNDVHTRYIDISTMYTRCRAEHAIDTICRLFDVLSLSNQVIERCKDIAADTQRSIESKCKESRQKDYENEFRSMMYDSKEEMESVVGSFDDNSFIAAVSEQTRLFCSRIGR